MMDIETYFSSSKKGDLSDYSKDDTDPKKAKEPTSNSSYTDQDYFCRSFELFSLQKYYF